MPSRCVTFSKREKPFPISQSLWVETEGSLTVRKSHGGVSAR
jgi:hypothetical protein